VGGMKKEYKVLKTPVEKYSVLKKDYGYAVASFGIVKTFETKAEAEAFIEKLKSEGLK